MRILREKAIGLVVDIQERLYPHIWQHQQLAANNVVLLRGLSALEVPVLLTQQYTKGLGPTIESVRAAIDAFEPIEKQAFSCCDEPAFLEALRATGRTQVLVTGIETHVCVLQTVLDLLSAGFQPVVVADCVSSRRETDKHYALQRMQQAGAWLSTYESVLFELARVSGTDAFRAISKLVK